MADPNNNGGKSILPAFDPNNPGALYQYESFLKFIETGHPGNTGRYGTAFTGEYVNSLVDQAGFLIFEEMRRNDSQIANILRAITLPIQTSNYFVEPASSDPSDKAIADEIEQNIFSDMEIPWGDVIRHICLMFPFGFMPMEMVLGYRMGKVILRKLAPRLPTSLYRWEVDQRTSKLKWLRQQDSNGQIISIPVEKLVLFTLDREGDNWQGRSLLRPAYRDWYIKNQLIKINAVKHERYGVGVPVVTARDGAKPKDEEWNAAEQAAQRIQASDGGAVMMPFGYTIKIMTPDNSSGGTDVIESIRYHDEQITKSILFMFANLGTSSSGSRSLGDVMLSMFLDSTQTYADYIAEMIDIHVVRPLVTMNYPGLSKFPRFKAGRIQKIDPGVIGALTQSGMLTNDPEIENMVRKSLNLPEKIIDSVAATVDKERIGDTGKDQQTPNYSEKKNNHVRGCLCGPCAGRNLNLAAKYIESEYHYAEKYINVKAYEMQLDGAENSLRQRIISIRNGQVRMIVNQLSQGRSIKKLAVPYKDQMFDVMKKEYEAQYEIGRHNVRQELQRQGNVHFAEKKKTPAMTVDFDEDYMTLLVDGAANKLASMTTQYYLDAGKNSITGTTEVLNFVTEKLADKLSDRTWEDLASYAVGNGYGAGREAEAEEQKDIISEAHYTVALEDPNNICAACLDTYNSQSVGADGDLSFDPDSPDALNFNAPNSECEGGPARCRCIIIYISGGVE